ncbi:glycosyltransferase family 4 protein [Paraferrimonas sp. SM1919]|uniref:glycosyltransferase family 4 protein n=1 Tax=Paraferrimonas sp. SM1919 TaxID=2662263 RepID=UPI0013D52C06|nr:glycosyltransferase family 4 protein [Paraferrimonas sp. SM1919]
MSNDVVNVYHIAPALSEDGGGISSVVQDLMKLNLNGVRQFFYGNIGYSEYHPGSKAYFRSLSIVNIFKLYYKLIRNENSYIYIHGAWSKEFFIISIIMRLLPSRVKCIYQPHGLLAASSFMSSGKYKKILAIKLYQGFIVKSSYKIIANSQKERVEFLSLLLNPADSRIEIIPNGVDNSLLNSFKAEECTNPTLLFMSQIIPVKGLESIIEDIHKSKVKSGKELTLDIYGYGSTTYVNSLKMKVNELGLSGQIKFKGRVEKEERSNIYSKYNMLVLPSKSESFGLVIIEALALGCSVLTTSATPWDSPLYTEHIQIYDPSGSESYLSLIQFYDNNNNLSSKDRLNNHLFVCENFSWNSIVTKIEKLYTQ